MIVLAGLAGLAAGAFSMAAVSTPPSPHRPRLAEAEIAVEREELRTNAAAEERELAAMYVDRGLDPDLAAEVARQLHRDPETALNVHAREARGDAR